MVTLYSQETGQLYVGRGGVLSPVQCADVPPSQHTVQPCKAPPAAPSGPTSRRRGAQQAGWGLSCYPGSALTSPVFRNSWGHLFSCSGSAVQPGCFSASPTACCLMVYFLGFAKSVFELPQFWRCCLFSLPLRGKCVHFAVCNIVIYSKKYISSSSMVPGPELLKPLEFPMMRNIKVSCVMLMK